MNSLANAISLAEQGYFSKALQELDKSQEPAATRVPTEIHRAVLLERVGQLGRSRKLLTRLSRSPAATESQRSICEFALGRIDWEEGERRSAFDHYRRAIELAEAAPDPTQKCWPTISLLAALSDSSTADVQTQALAGLRWDVLKLGNAHLLAALHAHMGSMEAKRGLFDGARSHLRRASEILATSPNIFLEALVALSRAVIALLTLDFEAAAAYAERSRTLSETSGSLVLLRASLANLALCFYSTGNFDAANAYILRAIAVLPPAGETRAGVLDTQARICLRLGKANEASQLIEAAERSIPSEARYTFAHRHLGLLKAEMLSQSGSVDHALMQIEQTLQDAQTANDLLLEQQASLRKALLLHYHGEDAESLKVLSDWLKDTSRPSADLFAQYEGVLACILASEGRIDQALEHRQRAERIVEGLHYRPGLIDLSVSFERALNRARSDSARPDPQPDQERGAATTVHSVVALLTQHGRHELIARHLVDLLAKSGAVVCAAATVRNSNHEREICRWGDLPDDHFDRSPICLSIGDTGDDRFQVRLFPKSDVQSTATVNAITLLLSTVQELERARVEREERLTLWPIEDVPVMNDHAVVNGAMRELMKTARRVATTNISVLLTGESGTGKEILARAIHTFSDRADQAFVPFNCAALPRDMLESQLFGHRRGAFTGADRDNPGVIRAARGGTLFLDEIGELSLDLQPKLLRVLESGEIFPLGETTPFTVNVRIIAATNARLEEAVKAGRFREDLFYRLNVVRLEIPPLRDRRDELPSLVHHFATNAAGEYRKGQIRIAENTMERLLLAPWPGNIRQLQNELRRMIALADVDAILTPDALSSGVTGVDEAAARTDAAFTPPLTGKLNPTLARLEREMIRRALLDHHGKMDAAAKALGISRKGLYLKRHRLGL